MSDYFAMSEQELNALAAAINSKTGHSGQILGANMASEVSSIASLASVATGGAITIDFDVPNYAFYYNTRITSITFGPNCHSIGENAFYGCTGLTYIDMSNSGITSIGSSAFRNCSNLKTISLPPNLSTIDSSAFYECTKLTGKLIFPASLTSIAGSGFYKCNLTAIEFNGTVPTTINSACFSYNSALTEVTILKTTNMITQSWTNQAYPFKYTPFDTAGNNAHIYYPSGYDYPNTIGWKATPYNSYLTPYVSSAIIGSDTYSYEYSKTFAEWVASAYNTDGFVVSGNNILNSAKTHYVAENGIAVSPTKQFIGVNYTLEAI